VAQIALDELGAELKAHRERQGVSLRAVAETTGVSASTLSRLERGHLPDWKKVERIASYLGVAVRTASGGEAGPSGGEEELGRRIKVHLRANKNLSEEAAREIARTAESYIDYLVDRRRDGDAGDG